MARTGKKRAEKAQESIDEQELQSRAKTIHGRLYHMNAGIFTVAEVVRLGNMPYKIHGLAVSRYDWGDLEWMEDLEKRVLMDLLPTE